MVDAAVRSASLPDLPNWISEVFLLESRRARGKQHYDRLLLANEAQKAPGHSGRANSQAPTVKQAGQRLRWFRWGGDCKFVYPLLKHASGLLAPYATPPPICMHVRANGAGPSMVFRGTIGAVSFSLAKLSAD